MRILLVEDCDFMAKAIKAALESNGHQVTWVIGFETNQPLLAIDSDHQPQAINARDFDIAFVDGQLEGKFEGPAIVEALSSRHIKCAGISSTNDLNDLMLAAGATMAMLKVTALGAIVENVLTPDFVQRPPRGIHVALESFGAHIRNNKELRYKLDQLVKPYMQ